MIKDGKKITLTADKHQKVSYLMIAGEDTVRNVMSLDAATRFLMQGKVTDGSDIHPHHPICVDAKYFFPGTTEEVDQEFLNAIEQPKYHEVKPIRIQQKPKHQLGKKRR